MGWKYSVKVSFTEIYNDQAYSLLGDTSNIKDNIEYVDCTSSVEVFQLCK